MRSVFTCISELFWVKGTHPWNYDNLHRKTFFSNKKLLKPNYYLVNAGNFCLCFQPNLMFFSGNIEKRERFALHKYIIIKDTLLLRQIKKFEQKQLAMEKENFENTNIFIVKSIKILFKSREEVINFNRSFLIYFKHALII